MTSKKASPGAGADDIEAIAKNFVKLVRLREQAEVHPDARVVTDHGTYENLESYLTNLLETERERMLKEVEQELPPEATEANKDRLIANWITSHENRIGFNLALAQTESDTGVTDA